jgi:hypothetical protein
MFFNFREGKPPGEPLSERLSGSFALPRNAKHFLKLAYPVKV